MQLCKSQQATLSFTFLPFLIYEQHNKKTKPQTLGIESSASLNYATVREKWAYKDRSLALDATESTPPG